MYKKLVIQVFSSLVNLCICYIKPCSYAIIEVMNRMKTEKNISLYLKGEHRSAYEYFGSHLTSEGVVFRVFAPNAEAVYVVGDFNSWSRNNLLKKVDNRGVFEGLVENAKEYSTYKYLIVTKKGEELYKTDPYGLHFELRPATATKVFNLKSYPWTDKDWIENRENINHYQEPLNIYEVNIGSFKKEALSFRKLADTLVPYVKDMGYTHIELMPVSEYPFDPSWGYQVIGYFGVTSRYGTPTDLQYFVNRCHEENIGVILDWVPGHYPKDEAGLYKWDGSFLFEYEDEQKRYHKGWGTAVFDFGKPFVRSFLISNALYWLQEYHFDGIRVDAVSSMLYLDYDRKEGEWTRNIYGGKENLEAIDFFKKLNEGVAEELKGIMMIAEESTTFPGLTRDVKQGGLGFSYKWNMGWMNDTLKYINLPEKERLMNPQLITFPISYGFSEKYILPLSHDEVVHLKASLLNKIKGEKEEKLLMLRAYLGYMMAHPGKKLLFMGGEIAQEKEWDFEGEVSWHLLSDKEHMEFQSMVKSLNHIYRDTPALYRLDGEERGFRWFNQNKVKEGVFCFERYDGEGNEIFVLSNFSKNPIRNIYLKEGKEYQVIFDTSMGRKNTEITASGVALSEYTTLYLKERR